MSVDIEKVLSEIGDSNAIIIIGNTEKCKPCRDLDNFLDSIRDKLNAKVINIDMFEFNKQHPDMAICNIPKILFLTGGKVVINQDGYPGDETMKHMIRSFFE